MTATNQADLLARKTLLIVDDSRFFRALTQKIVQPLGLDTLEATDGAEALRICEGQLPDAVLLDWNMPVMDGIDFLCALRRLPNGNQPKVIFCTTESSFDHIGAALRAGANEYIMKPFNDEILLSKLDLVGLL